MRISDWSSDVCSSDLLASSAVGDDRHRGTQLGARCTAGIVRGRPEAAPLRGRRYGKRRTDGRAARPRTQRSTRSEERRVGKSVSVRVDLGGRRLIKKKTTTQESTNQQEDKQLT